MSEVEKESMIGVKLGSIALLIAIVLSYSLYVKKNIEIKLAKSGELVLKEMPKFSLPVLGEEKKLSKSDFLKKSNLTFVHFWATWCAPCEAELPSFVDFIRKNKDKGVRAVLVGVQDEEVKMKKYLRKYGDLSSSFTLLTDKSGDVMARFGTVKLPETYLFSSNGKSLNKYVGPQDWKLQRFARRLNFYLSTEVPEQKSLKKMDIETH